eukprot:6144654-Pyramimonas_sp.AAC.1
MQTSAGCAAPAKCVACTRDFPIVHFKEQMQHDRWAPAHGPRFCRSVHLACIVVASFQCRRSG